MTALEVLRVASCAVHLAVAALALVRTGRSPLAPVLAALALELFAWNSAALAWSASGHVELHRLEMTLSPLTMAFVLHFVLAFVGRRRERRGALVGAYVGLGTVAALTAGSFVLPDLARFAGSPAWATLVVCGVVPVTGVAVAELGAALRRAAALEERVKTWVLLLALAFSLLLALTELLADYGVAVPRLSGVGTAVGAAMLGVVTLRFGLLGRPPRWVTVLLTLALAGVGVLAQVLVFRAMGRNTALLVGGSVVVTLGLLVAARAVLAELAVRSARTLQLAEMGRVAAQVAHDLKNPLAALRGAAQFLREERSQGRSIDGQGEFLDLMVDQLDRMQSVIDRYQELLRIDPARRPVALNEVVGEVLSLQRFGTRQPIAVRTQLASDLPACHADRGLLTRVLDNLVRNAVEAMPRGGTLTVSTSLETPRVGGARLHLVVEDTGEGLSPEAREHLFESFFTTKTQGSGLGLAFARKVAEAHGGDLLVLSAPAGGTVARLRLPVGAPQ